MTEAVPFPVDDYRLEVDPAQSPQNLICVDDRPTECGTNGWQHPGAPDGIARDLATAMEVQKPGSFTELGLPVHAVGPVVAKRLKRQGVNAYMHHVCAAHELATEINESTYEEVQEVFEQTAKFGLPVSESEMHRVAQANWRLDQSGLILPAERTKPELLNGDESSGVEPVPHLHLFDTPHLAKDMVVDYTGEAVWDSRNAFQEGNPAYFAGFGTLRAMHERLKGLIPVEEKYLMLAAVVRLSAISRKLPTPDNQPLKIHTIGEEQLAA